MPAPLSREIRSLIASSIRFGIGRNKIARTLGISAGFVTKVAREEGLHFSNDWMTTTATEAHQVDCELARLERQEELLGEYMALPQTSRLRDGKETRRSKKLSYALYDLDRHTKRRT